MIISKMDSNEQKKLRLLAGMLPKDAYHTRDVVKITGEDLLLSGHTEVNGKGIDKEKEYSMTIPAYHEMNHYRRLKKSFNKMGVFGVKKYMRKYLKNPMAADRYIDVIFKR